METILSLLEPITQSQRMSTIIQWIVVWMINLKKVLTAYRIGHIQRNYYKEICYKLSLYQRMNECKKKSILTINWMFFFFCSGYLYKTLWYGHLFNSKLGVCFNYPLESVFFFYSCFGGLGGTALVS